MRCCAEGSRLLLAALVNLQTVVYGCGTWFQVQTCLMCAGSTADSIAPPIFTTQLQFRHQSATMPVMGYKLPAEVGALAVTHVGADPRRSAAVTRFVLRSFLRRCTSCSASLPSAPSSACTRWVGGALPTRSW